jgi:HEAT repeat protein
MRPPSATTQALLDELRTGVLGREEYPPRLRSEALEDLAREPPHPRIALELAPWSLSGEHEIAQAAARVTDRVVRALGPEGVSWLDRHRRDRASIDPRREAWEALRPGDLGRLDGFGDASIALRCIASLHSNGYVRQASVERLAKERDGAALPFLLLRVNDWAPPVRAAAKAAVLARIAEARGGDVARSRELFSQLSLFDRLGSLGRDDHAPLREAFALLLAEPAFASVLALGMSAPEAATRLRCFRIALAHPGCDVRGSLARALADREGPIKLWAAREIVARLANEELRPMLETMRRDKVPAVRHEAIFALGAKTNPPDHAALEAALLDPSPTVRWTARHFLGQGAKLDARAYYVAALADPDPERLAAAIAGVGECGEKTRDAALVLPFRSHPSTVVRRAAIVALGSLACDLHMETLIEALRDERASVAREAATRLKGHAGLIGQARLAAMIQNEPRSHTRRMAVRIATCLPQTEALGLLLDAVSDPDARIAAEAARGLEGLVDWTRYAARFDAAVRDRIAGSLASTKRNLGERTFQALAEISAYRTSARGS